MLNATRKPPTDGSTHRSTRRLAGKLEVSHMIGGAGVEQAPAAAAPVGALQEFQRSELRAEGRRHHRAVPASPAHEAVFCVDAKTAIHALDRNDPVLPLSPGRAERLGFEY